MSTSNSDTQSINDQKLFIKQELLPNIAKMCRYLGAIDYDTHFHRRKQGRQTSWEFEDKETEDIFEATIIGEVASTIHGMLLKGIGNFKPPKSDPNLLLTDKSNVKNVIVLQKITGSSVNTENAFLNQMVPLNTIIKDVIKEDDRAGTKPTNGNQHTWVDSSAATNADRRPTDLIIISLPKKFDTPKSSTISSSNINRVVKRMPIMEEEEDDTANTAGYQKTTDNKVTEPKDIFALVKNKLIQHDIIDIDNELLPAWKIEHGLRPGTVVVISGTLHVYNINNTMTSSGFRHYYQINAEKIKVVAKPLPIDPLTTPQQPTALCQTKIFDDFALFTSKKRKEDKMPEQHSAKKSKPSVADVVKKKYDMMAE